MKFFDRCPADLIPIIQDSYNQSEWETFVQGSLRETKDKDARPLGGGKPMNVVTTANQQVDVEGKSESDDGSSDEDEELKFGEPLSRTMAAEGNRSSGGFGFSGSDGGDGEDDEAQVGLGSVLLGFAVWLMRCV